MREADVLGVVGLLWLLELAGGCATVRATPAESERPSVAATSTPLAPAEHVRRGSGLLFAVTPPDAEVFINGKSAGKVDDLERSGGLLGVKPGIYQVSLKRRGFVTWRAEVTVGDEAETIQVTLVESQ